MGGIFMFFSLIIMPAPAGPMTVILDSYDTIEQLKNAHPDGQSGDAYLVGGVLYVWDVASDDWMATGDLTGPAGPQGTGTTIKGHYDSKDEFEQNPPPGSLDDAYIVAGEIYIWNETDGWQSGGVIKGDQGEQGTGTTIKGHYDSRAEFEQDPPPGSLDDAYLVEGEIYIWNETDGWQSAGSLKGEQGEQGEPGSKGPGAIIPFSSGATETMSSAVPPQRNDIVILGYGNRVKMLGAATDPISISNIDQYAVSMPSKGTVSHISAFFSLTSASLAPGVDSHVLAQLFSSPSLPLSPEPTDPNNSFMPVPNTLLTLGPIGPYTAPGTTYHAEMTLDAPITFNAGTRFMLVFYHQSEPTGAAIIGGVMSGGLGIDGAE